MAADPGAPAKKHERPPLLSLREMLDLHLAPWEHLGDVRDLDYLKAKVLYAFARWLEIQRREYGDLMSEQAQACEQLTDEVLDTYDELWSEIEERKARIDGNKPAGAPAAGPKARSA